MPLRCLFIDMNSFFASVEQQDDRSLRGRPVAVLPMQTMSTCCIAASYEAKAFGVKTGTPAWQAREMCPGIVFRAARHERYLVMHNRIVAAVESVLPVGQVRSIDEMVCPLKGADRQPAAAMGLAGQIKKAVFGLASDYMRCSVGIGPNELLAKVAADMNKPDGLTVLPDADLPAVLHPLKLTDFPGIGPRMEKRLKLCGLFTVEQLCKAPAKTLALVWGSKLLGEKWWRLLRGEDVPEKPTHRQTVGHSHVLPPQLRTDEGAYGVLVRLTHKAAARLRKIGYWAGAVSVGVSYRGEPGAVADPSGWGRAGWEAGCKFPHCQDTLTVVQEVSNLWRRRPAGGVPFKVGMVLWDLLPERSATPSLFPEDRHAGELSRAMDAVNREFGAAVVYLGSMFGLGDAAPVRTAFGHLPDFDRAVR